MSLLRHGWWFGGLATLITCVTQARAYAPEATAVVAERAVETLPRAARALITGPEWTLVLAEQADLTERDPETYEAARRVVIAPGSSVADVKPGTLALEGALAEFELARVELSAAFRRADRVGATRALARLSQAACDLADPYGVNDALLPEVDGARAWFSDAIDRSLLASVVARSQRSMDPAALVVEASASRTRIEAAVEAGDGASVAAIRCELLSRAATLVAITASGALRPVVPATPAFRISPEPLRGPLTMWVEIESASSARVELFDLAGRRVRTHELGNLPAGASTVRIPTDWSEGLPSGVYLARLSAGSMRNERRVTRLAD